MSGLPVTTKSLFWAVLCCPLYYTGSFALFSLSTLVHSYGRVLYSEGALCASNKHPQLLSLLFPTRVAMSIPGAFGVPPHDDFQSYMRRAQLPLMVISKARAQSMPADGEHSHRNKLQVLQDGRRRLEVIEKFPSGPVDADTIRDCARSPLVLRGQSC